jgi:hypothetical protein
MEVATVLLRQGAPGVQDQKRAGLKNLASSIRSHSLKSDVWQSTISQDSG